MLYQHYVIAKAAWPLLVHDFNRNFVVKNIQQRTNVYPRKWAGLFKSADQGTLYRSRDKLGLGLALMTLQFEWMHTIKGHVVKYSKDPDIAALYQRREGRFRSHKNIWRPTQLMTKCIAIVEFDHKFQAADPRDNRGLGHGVFSASASHSRTSQTLYDCCPSIRGRKTLESCSPTWYARNLD